MVCTAIGWNGFIDEQSFEVNVGQKEKRESWYGLWPNSVPHGTSPREGRDYLSFENVGSSKPQGFHLGGWNSYGRLMHVRSNGPEVCNKATGLLEIHSVWGLFG